MAGELSRAADGWLSVTLPGMNPTVLAAAIGVSGTVIVGVAGFGAAIWNTRRTIAHDRESRIWDRRAAVYIEALAAVNYRQAKRKYATQTSPLDEASQRALSGLAASQEFDWHGLDARLQAFASEPVYTAVQVSSTASERAMIAFRAWRAAGASSETSRAVDEAREAAEAADDDVIETIRTELQGRGKPLGDWQPLPLQEAPGETRAASS